MKKIALLAIALLFVAAPLFAQTNMTATIELNIQSYTAMNFVNGNTIAVDVANGDSQGTGSAAFALDTNDHSTIQSEITTIGTLPGIWETYFSDDSNDNLMSFGPGSGQGGSVFAHVSGLTHSNAAGTGEDYSGILTVSIQGE